MSETKTVKLVLCGPLAGKTMMINGRQFVNGACSITAPMNQLIGAVNYYGNGYQAHPEGSKEHLDAAKRDADRIKMLKEAAGGERAVSEGTGRRNAEQVPGDVLPPRGGSGSEAPADVGGADASPPAGASPVAGGNGSTLPSSPEGDPLRVKKIAEAIRSLDPKNPAHRAEDGSPSVDAVSKAAGFAVNRAEIDLLTKRNPKAK